MLYRPGVRGKTVIVTGGASGLGRASAIAFARAGATVYVADVVREPREGGASTVDLIRQEGGTATHVDTDVSRWEDVDHLITTAAADTGRVDVLMTSAVFLGNHSKNLLETEPEDWDAMMNVNLRGVFMCCKRAMQQMLTQEARSEVRGRIITVASQFGFVGSPGHITYSACKGGVVNMTRGIAVDYGRQGVLVNAIAPGKVPTGQVHDFVDEPDEYYRSRTPFSRFGRPSEIGEVALFLGSDECSFMSGAIVPVDGGWLAY
jgi:NAD(P)-dependent dehydrogenase (short-subunit alcohol dehydrogenase family)